MPIAYEVVLNKLTTADSYASRVKPKNAVPLIGQLKDISAASTLASVLSVGMGSHTLQVHARRPNSLTLRTGA